MCFYENIIERTNSYPDPKRSPSKIEHKIKRFWFDEPFCPSKFTKVSKKIGGGGNENVGKIG